MSAAVEDLRGQLRASRKQPAAGPWRPPEIADLAHYVRVLAYDATLTHCGWLALEALPDRIEVHGKGIINIDSDARGYLETWDKARQLREALAGPMRWASPGTRVVVEAPMAAGGYARPESTLIAGLLIWLDSPRPCSVVSATHVSSVLLNKPRILSGDRKKEIRATVIRLIPQAAGRTWNEHIRDAASVALTYLHDIKRR